MSNPYPPTGGAYSGHTFADAGMRHHGLQTLSRDPSPAVNNPNFLANATVSSTTAHAVPPHIPPPPFHLSSDFFKQFANSSLPPPPYPPVPIPHLGFPQFPPPPPNFVATSTPPNHPLTNSLLPQQHNPPPLHSPHAPQYQQDTYTVAREEGELSDGELDASSPESMIPPTRPVRTDQTNLSVMPGEVAPSNQEARSPAAQLVTSTPHSTLAGSKSVTKQASGTSRAVFSDAGKMGNVFQRQKDAEDDRAPSADGDSISSYNPPSALTPGAGEPDMELVEFHVITSNHANPSLPVKVDHMGAATLMLREQAKDALRSLIPHNVKYNELVGEGVDPYVLRRLYEDLDQNVVPAKTTSPAAVADAQNIALQSPQPTQHLPDRSSGDASHDLQQGASTTRPGSNLMSVSSASEYQANSSLPDSSKASVSAAVRSEKAPVAPPSSNVAMERKDRIAQLLAAKTGKAIPPRPAPEKQLGLSAESPKSDSAIEATKKPSFLPEKPPLPSPEPTVKPKNKAQTELIRQKMEALKKEALAKSQAQSTTKVASMPSSPASGTPHYAADPQQLELTESAADLRSNGVASQIPGLFMTNLAHISDLPRTNRRPEHPLLEKVDEPISLNSTATSVSQETSAEFETNFVQSPGERILPTRLPQKRPLASDSFDDEAGPSPKRPFGRKETYDKVEIILSEAESDGEVEDVEMELDEESDEEKQTHQDGVVPALSVRERTIRNLPPLTDVPSPNPTMHSPSVIYTPTSTAVQTPGREKDKGDLWKAKHQEIELMRKKIAEMEERRKAKQSMMHASSPKAAGKAAAPFIRTSLARPSQPSSPGPPGLPPPVAANANFPREALQSPVLTPSRQEELPSTPSTPLYAMKEPVKAEDLRQKLLRRKATREGTPNAAEIEVRRAQLVEKRAKLAELRREAERREAEILEESKLLEAQLEAELNGGDTYEERPPNVNGNAGASSITRDQAASDAPQQKHGDAPIADGERSRSVAEASPAPTPEESPGKGASEGSAADRETVPQPSGEDSDVREVTAFGRTLSSLTRNHDTLLEREKDSLGRATDEPVDMATVPRQGNLPAAPVNETTRIEVNSPSLSGEDKVADEAPFNTIDSNLLDEDGSVSMSDSASEDYEPAEPDHMGDDQHENDSEFYEPADVAVPVDAAQLSASERAEVAEPVELDQTVTKDPSQSIKPVNEEPNASILIDDTEDGMQLTESDVVDKPQIISQSREDEGNHTIPPPPSHFTPYETPRKYFKNFRYHDHFPEIVSSGYKSMTFSNTIDPRRPFCPTELVEGTCEDPRCEEQHFRQVALTDDKILAQMSTANNLKTKAEHDRWVAGLRQVIADLRSKGVKDFHLVASALAAYRRRFSEELSTPTSASMQS